MGVLVVWSLKGDGEHRNDSWVDRISIAELSVSGCNGYFACAGKPRKPGSVIDDDARSILEKMTGAEALLLATPLYSWGFPGPFKSLVDRFVSLLVHSQEPTRSLLRAS